MINGRKKAKRRVKSCSALRPLAEYLNNSRHICSREKKMNANKIIMREKETHTKNRVETRRRLKFE